MRSLSLLGLVIVLLIVGFLVKKQFTVTPRMTDAMGTPASAPQGNAREQSQQIQQQYKQALESAMQPARAEPDDAK